MIINRKLIHFLNSLQQAFQQKSLYLFGAGMSSFYIEPQYDLYKKIKEFLSKSLVDPIIYDRKAAKLTEEQISRFKILGSPHSFFKTPEGKLVISGEGIDLHDILLHSQPAILELFCALVYSLKDYPTICPEYQIFNLIHSASVIGNLNHDGLANEFIKKRKIINLHERVPTFVRNFIQENLVNIIESGFDRELVKKFYFATKENEHILLIREEYKDFLSELYKDEFSFIATIGYSFFKKNDLDVYDVVTYDLVRNYIINKKCRILIIDINPDFVADMIAKTYNANILCACINWSAFCHALEVVCSNRLTNIYCLNKSQLVTLSALYDFYNMSLMHDSDNFPRYIRSSKIIMI